MKVNLNLISKRAKGFIKEPKFLNPDLDEDFLVTIDKSDKILTVLHGGKLGDLELLFSEVLAIFSKNRQGSDLWKINFREIENFLRDENHLAAFNEMLPELEQVLEKMKISLIASVIRSRMGASLDDLKWGVSHWEKLSLAAKNQWAQTFLNHLDWELVFCDGNILTVTGTPAGVSADALQLLANKLLGPGENLLPMKVVAV